MVRAYYFLIGRSFRSSIVVIRVFPATRGALVVQDSCYLAYNGKFFFGKGFANELIEVPLLHFALDSSIFIKSAHLVASDLTDFLKFGAIVGTQGLSWLDLSDG